MNALDEVLRFLNSQPWDVRCRIGMTRGDDAATVQSRGMQIHLREVTRDQIEVTYEHELHERTRELVSPEIAGPFVLELVMRKHLCRVDVPRV